MSALALDLGSTRIKAARQGDDGRLLAFAQRDAPPLAGRGGGREFDARDLEARAREALGELEPRPGERLGIASQRSTFLLWTAEGGEPRTPAISWQDRRAADWIARHPEAEAPARRVAGLPLSAHYVGPKLAALFEQDPALAEHARAGALRLGTLDAWLAWSWSGGRLHVTDESMAARTLLFDPARGDWSPELCALFGVPAGLLPRAVASAGREDVLDGGVVLAASAADQSAGALHAVGTGTAGALVNFGTGTFVLAPCGAEARPPAGYLSCLLASTPGAARQRSFAREGTINAAAGALAGRAGDTGGASLDSLPRDAHCVPDENGVGAPHWRADLGPVWSASAARLDPIAKRRLAELGLLFRARAILADLGAAERRCVVAGGVLHDAAFAQRAADVLGPIEVCLDPEATLLGAAALAGGLALERGRASVRRVEPGAARGELDRRFEDWRAWARRALAP